MFNNKFITLFKLINIPCTINKKNYKILLLINKINFTKKIYILEK